MIILKRQLEHLVAPAMDSIVVQQAMSFVKGGPDDPVGEIDLGHVIATLAARLGVVEGALEQLQRSRGPFKSPSAS